MADFDINSHLQQMGFGRGKQAAASDGTNEKSTIDALFDATGKPLYNAAKLTGLPINATELGQVGINKQFESEGITGKMIMPSLMPDAQGGFFAKLLYDIFVKNREITDHTSGSGGNASGDFAGGGGDFAGGGNFGNDGFVSSMADFSGMTSPSNSYDWSDIAWASLGALPRPTLPDMGPAPREVGIE